MIYILMTFISLIPVIILGVYMYHKDTIKEPKVFILRLFAAGFLASFITMIVTLIIIKYFPQYYIFGNESSFSRIQLFILIFIEISFLEELSKWLMVKIFGYKSKEFDEFYDIILYSTIIALGFAAVENIYAVVPNAKISLGIFRAISAVPAHAAFGVYMGYFFARAKMQDGYNKTKYIINILMAIFVPTVFHAIYNFLLMTENIVSVIIFILFISALYATSLIEVDRASKSGTKVK